MSEVIAVERFVKNFICDRDTYLALKADQKAILEEIHTGKLKIAFNAKMDLWWKSKPENTVDSRGRTQYSDQTEWRNSKPKESWILDWSSYPWTRRTMNIIYGIVKGNPYKKIEQKYAEGNEPDKNLIQRCCQHYGVDFTLIMGAIHG